ncbi:MAG: hypothetical protein MRJ68_08510 [Nitrospira sp.]|nr:hypothetical protein [Nitrospira sp.]
MSEWEFMHNAYKASLVWYGNGDIHGDNYKCQQEAASSFSGAPGYIHMPVGKNVMSVPMDSGGKQINQQLYHACMQARGYQLVDRYEDDKWRMQEANKGSLCVASGTTVGTLVRNPQGKMVKITALYGHSPKCSDPATPILIDAELVDGYEDDKWRMQEANKGSLCVASGTTVGTQVTNPNGKTMRITALYGTSPRCSAPATPILADAE